jgi:ribosomal protein S18 acetylase RimI-like enzyme
MSNRVVTKPPTLDEPLVQAVPANLRVRAMTKQDFDTVVQVVDQWWSGPIAVLAHPVFFYELGKHARVVEDVSAGGKFVGFLLGFILPPDDEKPAIGYVHLVGVHPDYRRKGVARALYAEFTQSCINAGCRHLKAITTPGNEGSLRYHQALGWEGHEEENYAGPNRRRLVLTKTL